MIFTDTTSISQTLDMMAHIRLLEDMVDCLSDCVLVKLLQDEELTRAKAESYTRDLAKGRKRDVVLDILEGYK